MNERSHDRGLSIVGPFILIGLGIVLLLQQLNMIQWSLWEIAFRLWPLIIIAVGADILIARRSFIGAVASLLVVLGLLIGGIYLMGNSPAAAGEKLSSEEVAYDLGDAASGDIRLSMDAGKMALGALSADSKNVIAGTIRQSPREEVNSRHNFSGTKVNVNIWSDWPKNYLFNAEIDHTWNLALTGRIPLDLDLTLGAGEIVADLTGLTVTSVNVKIGAGRLLLTLPENADMDVEISIGAGSAEIMLPDGTAYRIDCTTGVGNCELPNGSGFWGQDYTSPEYSSADEKIDMEVNVGVGEAKIVR
ncbi:MAG: hypothetical protein JW748_06420 [Anaerolineales bacterium]|nr:hypothetical protein [Anaerolineales bacterium]